MADSDSDSGWPQYFVLVSRFFGGMIGAFIGFAMVAIICIICLWIVKGVGSALLGWDLFT